MPLSLVHQPPGSGPLPPDMPLWRTCLREVAFTDEAAGFGSSPTVHGAEAYALLLEIVCGLRSPLVGETEVQAQFKTFLASVDADRHGWLLRLGQRVLADAKLVRHRHLQGFGAHSYGHLVERLVPAGRRVAVVGTGTLAAQLITALESAHPIDQWGRTDVASSETHGARAAQTRKVWTKCSAGFPREAGLVTIIVAAPIAGVDLERIIRQYDGVMEVIDLRARDGSGTGVCGKRTMSLDDVFASAETAVDATSQVETARHEVRRLADAFGAREQHRPFGWDDLCG